MGRVRYPRGMTLVELIAVIVILAILAGVAVPKYFDHSNKAKAAAIAHSLKAIKHAILQYRMNTGSLPPDQLGGIMPPELLPYLSNDAWIFPVPGVGVYNWDGPPGWAPPTEAIGIAVTTPSSTPLTDPLWLEVDRMIDDGNLSAGFLRWESGSGRYRLNIDAP